MIVAVARPLQIVHAQAVYQHDQLRAGVGDRVRQSIRAQRERLACVMQLHRQSQRIAGGLEVIAEHAVQRRDDRFALCRGAWMCDGVPGKHGIDDIAGDPSDPADAAIDQPRDPAGTFRRRTAQPETGPRDRGVHRFDQVGDADGRIHAESRETVQVGKLSGISVEHRRCDLDDGDA
jgi:hypothetical protein